MLLCAAPTTAFRLLRLCVESAVLAAAMAIQAKLLPVHWSKSLRDIELRSRCAGSLTSCQRLSSECSARKAMTAPYPAAFRGSRAGPPTHTHTHTHTQTHTHTHHTHTQTQKRAHTLTQSCPSFRTISAPCIHHQLDEFISKSVHVCAEVAKLGGEGRGVSQKLCDCCETLKNLPN